MSLLVLHVGNHGDAAKRRESEDPLKRFKGCREGRKKEGEREEGGREGEKKRPNGNKAKRGGYRRSEDSPERPDSLESVSRRAHASADESARSYRTLIYFTQLLSKFHRENISRTRWKIDYFCDYISADFASRKVCCNIFPTLIYTYYKLIKIVTPFPKNYIIFLFFILRNYRNIILRLICELCRTIFDCERGKLLYCCTNSKINNSEKLSYEL